MAIHFVFWKGDLTRQTPPEDISMRIEKDESS